MLKNVSKKILAPHPDAVGLLVVSLAEADQAQTTPNHPMGHGGKEPFTV